MRHTIPELWSQHILDALTYALMFKKYVAFYKIKKQPFFK